MARSRRPKPPRATSAAKSTPITEVVVEYDLFNLPTAFHKAGLAGLILLMESLKSRLMLSEDDAKFKFTATGAKVTFTQRLVRKLFDDMYDAEPGEVRKKATSHKKNPEASEEKKKPKESPPIPKLTALRDMLPHGDELWIKLWRDMIFQVPRSQPATWKPYKDRIAGREYAMKNRDPWADLKRHNAAHRSGLLCTGKLSGSLLLGIQEDSPEMVPCLGCLHHNLLLHFWPLAVLLFAPQQLKVEKKNGELQVTTDFGGNYTLAVPDILDLKDFVQQYPKLLASLRTDPRGYRPAQAVIDLPAEGALAFLDDLAELTGLQVETGELRFAIGAVEYLHVLKEKRNVKTMAAGRVAPNRRLLSGYRAIVCPKDESTRYRNPLFRRGLLLALLDGLDEQWYRPFGSMFSTFDAEVFIRRLHTKEDDKGLPQFATDAAKKFHHQSKLYAQSLERYANMPENPRPTAPLGIIVNRVVRNYLLARTQEKTDIDPEKYKKSDVEIDWKSIPGVFNETKQKLALSLILEFRSRREQAFVDHFAATFFSVTQRLTEADRLELANLLTAPERRDDLKTLVLLSLSANS